MKIASVSGFAVLLLATLGASNVNAQASCNRMCTEEYSPICGTNGVTYGNRCFFNVAKCKKPSIQLKNVGECTCDRVCTEVYSPICGTDGVTYDNRCFFNVAKCKKSTIQLKHVGEC